jgi:flagellar P-ring protein FlgI
MATLALAVLLGMARGDGSEAAAPVTVQQDPGPDIGVYFGGVQAPTQPWRRSTATVSRLTRTALERARGTTGAIRVRIQDLVDVRGLEHNVVHGVGLVTGLMGTGDSGLAARQAIANVMLTQNIKLDPASITSNNVAVVWIEVHLPAGVKPGRRVDARVSSIYDSESLVGGTLIWAELTDPSGQHVYGTASGPITTGAFSASGEGASVTRNHTTVGLIPLGCKVEREIPSTLVSEMNFLYLDMQPNKASFGNAVRIAEAINERYLDAAVPIDNMTVQVRVPYDLPQEAHIAYLNSVLQLTVEPEASSRVIINERTGVIVMGEQVRIGRGAITKGSLTVTIAETPEASQPGAFTDGATQNLPRTDLVVEEQDAQISLVNGAATLNDVVEVMNLLNVTPRDMIQILQAMSQAGMLHAEVVIQ